MPQDPKGVSLIYANLPSGSNLPLVTIIMPSYNHAQYVREALKSVAAQTYPNIELIIIDDGSRDETPRIIKEALTEFTRDMRIEFRRQENAGLCTTLNRALDLALGEFVQFLASDDTYLPEKTALSVEALRAAALDVAAIYCDGYIMDERSRRRAVFSEKYRVPIGKNVHRELLIANWIPAMGILYRRDILVALGGFDKNLMFEDWDLLLRLTHTHRVGRIPDRLFLYRVHSTSMTRDTAMMQKTTADLVRKHPDLSAFHRLKSDLRRNPVTALWRHRANSDMVFRVLARRTFTNRGIQGETFLGAVRNLSRMMTVRATATLRGALHRLAGVQLGRRGEVRGRLRWQGNLRNLTIGDDVIFEGDAEFILPRGVGQGRIVIGNGSIIAHGALFHCMTGELTLGSSSYVGRNAVLQSNGDLSIGAWTVIAANAGLYASNHVISDKDQPNWAPQGNSFSGITLGENCRIGHGGVVVDGTKLGAGSIVEPNRVARGVHAPGSQVIGKD